MTRTSGRSTSRRSATSEDGGLALRLLASQRERPPRPGGEEKKPPLARLADGRDRDAVDRVELVDGHRPKRKGLLVLGPQKRGRRHLYSFRIQNPPHLEEFLTHAKNRRNRLGDDQLGHRRHGRRRARRHP